MKKIIYSLLLALILVSIGSITNAKQIKLESEKLEKNNVNNDLINVYEKSLFDKYFIAEIELTTFSDTIVSYTPVPLFFTENVFMDISIVTHSDNPDEIVAIYKIDSLSRPLKESSVYETFGCGIDFFIGEIDFELPEDSDGGYLKGLAFFLNII